MPAYMTITARLARDPETRTSNKGTSVCKLTLPVDTGWGDNKRTTWWTVSLFGKRAETAGAHLGKGQWVAVSGKPEVRTYEKKDGNPGIQRRDGGRHLRLRWPPGDSPEHRALGRSGYGLRLVAVLNDQFFHSRA